MTDTPSPSFSARRLAPLRARVTLPLGALLLLAAPLAAKDSLGTFDSWGAFRDAGQPRCYAVAMAIPGGKRRDYQPFASVGTWPRKQVRNQLHFRLSRAMAPKSRVSLNIRGKRFALIGGAGDAWAADAAMDAAIVAAMRSAGSMTVSARDVRGNFFSNSYDLAGAATAMDAATLGCARLR